MQDVLIVKRPRTYCISREPFNVIPTTKLIVIWDVVEIMILVYVYCIFGITMYFNC